MAGGSVGGAGEAQHGIDTQRLAKETHEGFNKINPCEKHPCLARAVYLIAILTLIAGAVLWGVGASHGNPSMLMAGKVLTWVGLAPFVLRIFAAYCIGYRVGCPAIFRAVSAAQHARVPNAMQA